MTTKKKRRTRPAKETKPPEKKWESFERIVAAIHAAEMTGATVTWDERIRGRQFDVTIRFKAGFYDYLTLIECRDYATPVSVEKVEAFVTKARSHHANKAIMVAANGFQSGAKQVAQREGIELYSLRSINKLPDSTFTGIFLAAVEVRPIAFRKRGQLAFGFSNDPTEWATQFMTYRLTGYGEMTLERIVFPFTQLVYPVKLPGVPEIESTSFEWKRATPEAQRAGFRLMERTKLIRTPGAPLIDVDEFLFLYRSVKLELLDTDGIDPGVFESINEKFEYKNELTDETVIIDPQGLHFGIGNSFTVGTFYVQPPLKDFVFYCEDLTSEYATLVLVRSVQHGHLIRMRMSRPYNQSEYFVPVTDAETIQIYQGYYTRFLEYSKVNPAFRSSDGDSLVWISAIE